MTDKQLQKLIDETKSVRKEYPYFDFFAEVQSGKLWHSLSEKQQNLVKQALMPRGETGITPNK